MSGLLALLQQGATSLQAHQAASATASNNLANSNTAGYARQRAELAADAPAERFGDSYIGRGVVLAAVSQARDRFVEAQLPAAIGQQMASSTESETLQGVTAIDVDKGLAPAVSNFYTQLRALAQNPSSLNYRAAAISAAKQLAFTFNRTSTAIEGARTAIDDKLQGRLAELNGAAAQLARLNSEISSARAGGGEPNDLLDARQRLGDRLAELVGATPVASNSGDLNLVLPDGSPLVVGSKSSTFSVQPDATNQGHSQLLMSRPDGSVAQPLGSPPGGELGGLIAARDGALGTASTQLDQLAFDFSSAINAVSQAGVALDGSTGRSLFGGITSVTGAARNMTLDAAIAADPNLFPAGSTNAPGDSGAVQAMVDTDQVTLSGGSTVSGVLARITADYGASAQRIASISEGDSAMLSHLQGMRESASGVSVDEEMINMQKAQRAYEAVTRVIKTADEMLDTLMSLK
ncbi:MAG: flagellar hook-associated protein FlgK [Myxococcaceae bacterium]